MNFSNLGSMKKIVFILSLITSVNVGNAQTICDSLSLDTVYVDANSFNITVYNSSQHFIVYPFFSILLDANPYISFNNNLMVPSFLSIANDANVGFTSGNYFDINLTPAAQVPQNTQFTGMLMIQDPNDSTFLCGLPFNFLYGDQLAAVAELSENQFSIYPNPSSGFIHINAVDDEGTISVIDQFGRIIRTEKLNTGKASLHLEKEGIYFIQVSSKHGQSTQKISVLE
jgi:hypothetical protein